MSFSLSIPSAIRWKDSFFDMGRMKRRDERLKESQRNAEKCRRELRRDRADLEQREKELVSGINLKLLGVYLFLIFSITPVDDSNPNSG